jgi:hypothetical protein
MSSTQCPFCEHENPRNARFCNACGVRLHAILCPQCQAVNDLAAIACIACGVELLDKPQSVHCLTCGVANESTAVQCAICGSALQCPDPSIPKAGVAAPGMLRMGRIAPEATESAQEPVGYTVSFDNRGVKIDSRYGGLHTTPHHETLVGSARPVGPEHALAALNSLEQARLTPARLPTHDVFPEPNAPALAPIPRRPALREQVRAIGGALAVCAAAVLVYAVARDHPSEISAIGSALHTGDDFRDREATDGVARTTAAVAGNFRSIAPPQSSATPAPVDAISGRVEGETSVAPTAAPLAPPPEVSPCTPAVAALGLCSFGRP